MCCLFTMGRKPLGHTWIYIHLLNSWIYSRAENTKKFHRAANPILLFTQSTKLILLNSSFWLRSCLTCVVSKQLLCFVLEQIIAFLLGKENEQMQSKYSSLAWSIGCSADQYWLCLPKWWSKCGSTSDAPVCCQDKFWLSLHIRLLILERN